MIGITDAAQFWNSFWPSLLAGAIDTLPLGIIVGIVLFKFQANVSQQELQQKCEREIATFKERLRYTLNQPDSTFVDNIMTPTSLVKVLVGLFSELPIELWYVNAQSQRKFLRAVKEFQKTHTDFSLIAAKLQMAVRSTIRRVNNSKGIGTHDDGTLQTFFLGRTLGYDNNNILPWMGIGVLNESHLPSYEERYTLVMESITVQELKPSYIEARTQVVNSAEALKVALAEPVVQKPSRLRSIFILISSRIG